jgi:hypothetical protein
MNYGLAGTSASMLESIRVERRCWANSNKSVALACFAVRWHTPGHQLVTDQKSFDFGELIELPDGSVPMLTAIFDPDAEPPDNVILAHVYLLRVNADDGFPDVVARLIVQTERTEPDQPFVLSGELAESGDNIYPLEIHEAPVPERDQ